MKKENKHKDGVRQLTTMDVLKDFFNKKRKYKIKTSLKSEAIPPAPPGSKINHLAIILDGEVQEIMRAQNRLTALLLSKPLIIEFDPEEIRPEVGWLYSDGKFFNND